MTVPVVKAGHTLSVYAARLYDGDVVAPSISLTVATGVGISNLYSSGSQTKIDL